MTKALLSGILALVWTSLSAQDDIGTYEMSYDSGHPNYTIQATEEGKFYIACYSLDASSKEGGINVDPKKLEEFKTALTAARDRFVEWSAVAKTNNVTELDKEMDIASPRVGAYWLTSKWHFSFNETLKFRFKITKDGQHILIINTGKIQASDNQYINHAGLALVFLSAEEVNGLISGLDPAKVTAYFEEKKKKADLFK